MSTNTHHTSDNELAARAAGGDTDAFSQLYERHYQKVLALCLRMLKNTADAEDFAQDVFLQLHDKIGGFRGDSAFTTWLHRMTVNRVLMHFRKMSTRSELLTEEGELPVQVTPGTENPRAMPVVDRISLERAVAALPPGYRAAFILHDVEGYEHHEIGRLLGCHEGTSKSNLFRARRGLRASLTALA